MTQKDKEGNLIEPCLSCEKCFVEDIWGEFMCFEKECPKECQADKEVSE